MNKLSMALFAVGISVGSISAQTTIQAPSYTNADLGVSPQGTALTTPNAIPGLTPSASTSTKYPPLTPEQQQQFVSQMEAQVQKAETRVQDLTARATNNTQMPMSSDKMFLENAIINLGVKKTLVEKFAASPSLRSPKVRQVLMNVLSNDDIQAADLAGLQAIVNSERPYTFP